MRRARGVVPRPVRVARFRRPVLAVGAQLKNTFCLARGDEATLGPHVGDLDNLATLAAFEAAVARTGARGHRELGAMLAATSADCVILATPSGLHPAQAMEVARGEEGRRRRGEGEGRREGGRGREARRQEGRREAPPRRQRP